MAASADDPFAPPAPDPDVSVGTVVGGTVVAVALALTPLLEVAQLLDVVGLFVPAPSATPLTPAAEAALVEGTAAPRQDGAGQVACTRCDARVPYASMSLSDRGYFCAPCVRALTGG